MSNLTDSLETVRTSLVTKLKNKGVTCATTDTLNVLVGKVNTIKTPVSTSVTLQSSYPSTMVGYVSALRDEFRVNLSKQGISSTSTDGLTTLTNLVNNINISTTLSLSSSSTSLDTGGTITLSATLRNQYGSNLSGKTVTFYNGSSSLGTSTTGSNGVATKTFSTSSAGTYTFTCKFSGDNLYVNSSSNSVSVTYNNPIVYINTSMYMTGDTTSYSNYNHWYTVHTTNIPDGAYINWFVDGIDGGVKATTTVQNGSESSAYLTIGAVGSHEIRAIFYGQGIYLSSVATLTVVADDSVPPDETG